jgi:hypothetical protein
MYLYAVHDYFKHVGGRDIFLLDWRQVLSYDVSFLNIRIVVNFVINLVNKNLSRTALQICMFHFNFFYPTSTRRHGNFAGVHTLLRILLSSNSAVLINKKFVTQSRTGLQIYEGHDDQLNRPGPMA